MKKKLKAALSRLPRLPRKWRLVRNVICILLAVYFIWLFLGCRSLTATGAFRRAERENMVGPSEIVYRTKIDDRRFLFGKVTDGYLAGNAYWGLGWGCKITHWGKGDDITLIPVGSYHFPYDEASSIELLLLHEMNGVVRGEAKVTLSESVRFGSVIKEVTSEETYQIQFEPCGESVLSGWLSAKSPDDGSPESKAERYALGKVFSGNESIQFEIWLYDGQGELVFHDAVEYSYIR